jgi:sugar O-acyltransferase (sialic acid O-acetyltransferase NeuD family)
MTDVVILGAGGLGRETSWLFEEANRDSKKWNVLGFVDDNPALHGVIQCDLPVLGGFEWFERRRDASLRVICATGSPASRRALAERAAALSLEFCQAIHPSARISRWVELGPGTMVAAGSVLTTQIQLGAHALVQVNSNIGHDCTIGAYCNINPGCHVSGNVKMGEGVDFGAGATVIQGKQIGEWSVIGAGAVVTQDIPAHVTAVGVPCRVIKRHPAYAAMSVPLGRAN